MQSEDQIELRRQRKLIQMEESLGSLTRQLNSDDFDHSLQERENLKRQAEILFENLRAYGFEKDLPEKTQG